MGDRICVRVTDGHRTSPTVYCHWAGLGAIMAMHRAVESSRREVSNILCNFIVTAMGRCRDSSYYIYNDGEAEGMADWDNWTWTLDISDMTWTTTMPCLAGRRITIDQAEEIAITSGYGAVAEVTA